MRAEHIHYRVNQQKSTRERIQTAYSNLLKIGRSNLTLTRIQNRIEAVEEQWHQFDLNHQAIELALSQVDFHTRNSIKERSYFISGHYNSTYETYLETTEMMKDVLQEKSSLPTTSFSSGQQMEEGSTSFMGSIQRLQPRLPRIDLPKFNGTSSEWLSFKGLYISLVYSNQFIDDVAKLQYLKTSLIGPAAFLLKGTDLIADNFQPAWDSVIAFYENERRLVNSSLKMLFAQKKMTKDSSKELENLYMSFNEVYRTLDSLNRPVQYYDDFLVFMMVQRLDPESIKAWEIHLGATKSTPTWHQLKDFLESRLLSLQSFENSQTAPSYKFNMGHQNTTARTHYIGSTSSCLICSQNHRLYQCDSFLAKSTKQRRDFVTSNNLCFNCLGSHKVAKCQSTSRCRNCGNKHHTRLHLSEQKSTLTSTVETDSSPSKQVNHACTRSQDTTTVLLATAKAVIKTEHGDQRTIWALLDQGSEISLISERIVQTLQLPRQKSSISIIGVGENQAGRTKGKVDLVLTPHFDSSISIEIQAFILPKLTSILPSSGQPAPVSWDHLKNLQLADPAYNTRKEIDVIIGADYYGQLLEGSIIKGPMNTPVAQLTKLGWVISGPVNTIYSTKAAIHHCLIDQELNKTLEKFWTQEELPHQNSTLLSVEDQLCEDHFVSTHQRDSTGRYVLRLPFKTSPEQLGNSTIPSQRALHHLASKFERNSELFNDYSAFIEEYKRLKHMIKAPNQLCDPAQGFYLPHHGVLRESSTTTKLRVVFNGSCRVPNGKPLNELLHTGAKQQIDLFDVLLWPKGEKRPIWALLDQGSEISLISERIVQTLQLPRQKSSISIIGVGENQAGRTKGKVDLVLTPHFDSSISIEIQAFILPKLTSILPSSGQPAPVSWDHLKNLQLADPAYNTRKEIDVIIGADYYGQLLEGSIIKGPMNTPVAQLTKLGWVISGPVNTIYSTKAAIHHCLIDQELNKTLEKFWTQEELPHQNSTLLSVEDQLCEDHFVSTHQRDSTGRYVLRLPFKTSPEQLGNSTIPSQRALHHLASKFERNSELFNDYSAFIEEYKRLKHMIKAPNQLCDPAQGFYLPHHGVLRESSTTTKLRVVFNGSCRVPNGKPLNELLHTGAKQQIDLFDVLLWFRRFKYTFSADIEKMYRQINIHADDWDYQRILWREEGRIVKYQLTTVTYGLACAPFQALRTMHQLIKDEGENFPQAIDTLKYGRYVDDIFGGSDFIEEAQEKSLQLKQICMAGGFPLKKWVSNKYEVLSKIPVEDQASAAPILLQNEEVRALGLSWNHANDVLQFKFSFPTRRTISKRSVLSKIAQLFDPLGLLAPIFIRLKIFMQELWAVKLTWDEQLPEGQRNTWVQLENYLEGLDTIHIPRWIGMLSSSQIEIHGFSDASQVAMAAAVFIRTSNNGTSVSKLLCSKTKVAPLKRMTIPRLELSAAVMLAKLVKHCQQVLKLNASQCHLWTDSTIVHIWISNHPSKWKDFVHNRVCVIQESLPLAQWHHIDGKSNPADCATRGLSAEELKSHSLWWTGPKWLSQDYTQWPKSPPNPTTNHDLETKSYSTNHIKAIQPWDLMIRYSSWRKLVRIVAWCQRMVALIRRRPAPALKNPLTPEELNTAMRFIVKHFQAIHFHKEIQSLKQEKDLPRNSSLVRLCPFLDKYEILRVGGRLKNALLSEDTKHPCILPRHANVSNLIIEDAHQKTLHGATRDTLSYLRQKYWVVGGRLPVKSVILKCVTCSRHRRQHAQYLMGQLPPSRVTPSRPFLHSGVDYAGPFTLKTWQGKARLYKAWIAVFVCFSTSAVHLEIVSNYSSEAFVASYKRFTSRRGICATITSDCGTTFQGADKELKKLFAQHSIELHRISSLIASDGTKWKFNPPSAPHFSGKAEAAVKSMKYHLKRLIGETKHTYEQLSTIVAQIEAIMNSRPLCALTEDPDDLAVLTPGHFIVGHSLSLIPEPNIEQIRSSRLSQWQNLTKIIQSFWTTWSKEYLQRHLSIYKWNKSSKPIAKGDLVFVMDERVPPTKWPLGRVVDVHVGKDNIVRVVTVKTSASTYLRPVVKLSPLPIAS